MSRVTTCGRSTRSVRGSPTALGPAFPDMSQARDSAEIRRAIPGLFACDLAGQTNSGSHHAREETLRCVAMVNSATHPLTLLETLLETKNTWKHAFPGKEPESADNLSDLPIDGGQSPASGERSSAGDDLSDRSGIQVVFLVLPRTVCCRSKVPTRRRIESTSGKTPTASVRRLISRLNRSIGLVL